MTGTPNAAYNKEILDKETKGIEQDRRDWLMKEWLEHGRYPPLVQEPDRIFANKSRMYDGVFDYIEHSVGYDTEDTGKIAPVYIYVDDPDIDAVSRLFWPIRVTGMRPEVEPNFGLFPGTWCPFNNQNTAMAREILPAYFTPHNAKRFSDIWPAYVVCRIAQHLNHVISYGHPFVRQIRNPHNYWQDIDDEKVGAQATEPLVDLLRSAELEGNNYHDCLGELIAHLNAQMPVIERCPSDQREMLTDFIKNLEVWHEVFDSIQDVKS